VTLFDVAEGEHVVSVARLAGAAEAPNGGEEGGDLDDGETGVGDEPRGDDEPGGEA
jgi:hypothetical protein